MGHQSVNTAARLIFKNILLLFLFGQFHDLAASYIQ
jgi:hypothetical protein